MDFHHQVIAHAGRTQKNHALLDMVTLGIRLYHGPVVTVTEIVEVYVPALTSFG